MELTTAVCLLLSEWITFLVQAVPVGARLTFIELLIGCMLSPEGWVTRAIGAVCRGAHWTTYYKLIERANVSVADVSIRLLQLIQKVMPNEVHTWIIDDTLVPRCAQSGPGVGIKHDHSHKANRPTFLNSQCWVTLAIVVRVKLGSALTVPIRSWLLDGVGQRGKLWVARQLIDSLHGHIANVRLLIDAWYMRKNLMLPLIDKDIRIIGQVRRDTALYFPPEPEAKRPGRKRKYGRRIDEAMLRVLPEEELILPMYGKMQCVRLRSTLAVVRFLKGLTVRAVWCQMLQDDGAWSRVRLILATETHLLASEVLTTYAFRWGVESLFHNLKRWWGVINLWQRTTRALELWMQIRSSAYALMVLLALQLRDSFPWMDVAPWRKGTSITAGLFAQWFRIRFAGLRVRDAYDLKSAQFAMPYPGQDQRLMC